MGFKIKKTVNGETVWEPIKAKKYTASKTIEYTGALPITINADGNALIDYRIYGNTAQTSTPTPENPIVPSGCGIQTENLFDGKLLGGVWTSADMNQRNANGAVYRSMKLTLSPGIYTLVFSENVYLVRKIVNGVYSESNTNISDMTFTVETLSDVGFSFRMPSSSQTSWDDNVSISVNTGSTALPYEPYGYKLPMVSRGENLWNSELEQGTFDISTGEERDASERIRSDYIHIQNSDNYTITLTGAEGVVVYVYDANKSFLSVESTVEWRALPFTREIEANRYVRFAFAKSASGDYYEKITPSDVSNIMLVKGSTAPESYIPYYREETPIYIGDTQLGEDEYVDYGEQKVYRRTEQLFNAETAAYKNGFFKNDDGVEGQYPSAGYYETYIPITPGETIYVINVSGTENLTVRLYFYDAQKQWILRTNGYVGAFSVVTPSNAAYAQLQISPQFISSPNTITITQGSTVPSTYIPYLQPTDPPVPIPALPTIDGETIIDYNPSETPAVEPEKMYVKYNSWSGWSDIDNYKMVNGNWTQEIT